MCLERCNFALRSEQRTTEKRSSLVSPRFLTKHYTRSHGGCRNRHCSYIFSSRIHAIRSAPTAFILVRLTALLSFTSGHTNTLRGRDTSEKNIAYYTIINKHVLRNTRRSSQDLPNDTTHQPSAVYLPYSVHRGVDCWHAGTVEGSVLVRVTYRLLRHA